LLHCEKVPPPQRQQDMQSPSRSHRQQTGVSLQGHIGHVVVTPSQVTDPRWPISQFRSTAEQVLLPSQLTGAYSPQLAWALQMDR
jgi:hypothetical protein